MQCGDNFALWVTGKDAGVYILGEITSGPEWRDSYDKFWLSRPQGGQYFVDVAETHLLFDAPLWKADLLADPVLFGVPVISRYWAGGPLEMTSAHWQALQQAVSHRGRVSRTTRRSLVRAHPAGIRPAGHVREDQEVVTPEQRQRRSHREDRLVRDYVDYLGRQLDMRRTPVDGGWIECDAYDRQTNTLIEAKAASDRNCIRMAIGQLHDYKRFIKPRPHLAVLLPEAPSGDLIDLLRLQSISVIVRSGGGFKTLP